MYELNKSDYRAILDLVTTLVNVKTISAFSEMLVNAKELLGFNHVYLSELVYHKTCTFKLIFTDDKRLENFGEHTLTQEIYNNDINIQQIKDGKEVLKVPGLPEFFNNILLNKYSEDVMIALNQATYHLLSKMNKETMSANVITFMNVTQDGSDKFDAMAGYLNTHLNHTYGRIMSVGDLSRGNLSDRELSVITWLKYGKTSWEVARILDITENTVNFHIKNIKRKLNATNRQHAVAIAIAKGILD